MRVPKEVTGSTVAFGDDGGACNAHNTILLKSCKQFPQPSRWTHNIVIDEHDDWRSCSSKALVAELSERANAADEDPLEPVLGLMIKAPQTRREAVRPVQRRDDD